MFLFLANFWQDNLLDWFEEFSWVLFISFCIKQIKETSSADDILRSNDQIKSQPFDHPNHFRSKSYPHSTLEVTIKNGFFDHRHNQDSEAKAKKSALLLKLSWAWWGYRMLKNNKKINPRVSLLLYLSSKIKLVGSIKS